MWPKIAAVAFVGAFALYHATKPDRIEPVATQQMPLPVCGAIRDQPGAGSESVPA